MCGGAVVAVFAVRCIVESVQSTCCPQCQFILGVAPWEALFDSLHVRAHVHPIMLAPTFAVAIASCVVAIASCSKRSAVVCFIRGPRDGFASQGPGGGSASLGAASSGTGWDGSASSVSIAGR